MPFKSLLCNAPAADQSLTSGFPHNKWGKGLVVGSDCALNCALLWFRNVIHAAEPFPHIGGL